MAKPILITRQSLAAEAAERWRKQYQLPGGGWYKDSGETYQMIVALGLNPNPDDVDATIGNDSWTRITCDGCGQKVTRCVRVGDDYTEGEYEACIANLCEQCVRAARDAILTPCTPSN